MALYRNIQDNVTHPGPAAAAAWANELFRCLDTATLTWTQRAATFRGCIEHLHGGLQDSTDAWLAVGASQFASIDAPNQVKTSSTVYILFKMSRRCHIRDTNEIKLFKITFL